MDGLDYLNGEEASARVRESLHLGIASFRKFVS
jgi:hypothetical protein